MSKRTLHGEYFCGNRISEYGLKKGYLDYRTLAKAFDAVLVNDITKLFYGTINGEYSDAEQVNGYIDNYDAINELQEQIDELENDNENREQDDKINELQEQIDELECEQEEQREIFQYFIVSENGADIIKDFTDDPLFYLPVLDVYVWGITHFGTSWDYVLTDCKIEVEG